MIISVGVTNWGMVNAGFACDLAMMMAVSATRYRMALTDARSSLPANARNQCVEAAQAVKADWLLMIDADMRFPYDTLVRLMAHEKDVVGGVYVRRGTTDQIIGTPLVPDDVTGLTEMQQIGTGCILINMKVFDLLPRPWFRHNDEAGNNVGEDIQFCRMVRDRGVSVWADIDLDLGHVDQVVLRCPK